MILMLSGFAVLWVVGGGLVFYVLGAVLDATVLGFGFASLVMRKRALDADIHGGTVTPVTGVVAIGSTHRGRQARRQLEGPQDRRPRGHHDVFRARRVRRQDRDRLPASAHRTGVRGEGVSRAAGAR